MELKACYSRILFHFEQLKGDWQATAGDMPTFAPEHGLSDAECEDLGRFICAHITIAPPSNDHAHPWIVYAAESLTSEEVDELLQFAKNTIYSMAQKGEVLALNIRGQWHIRRADRGAWIAAPPRRK